MVASNSTVEETPVELASFHSEKDDWTNVSTSGDECDYEIDYPIRFVDSVVASVSSPTADGVWKCRGEIQCPAYNMCDACFEQMQRTITSW